jgi:hypothetical protein
VDVQNGTRANVTVRKIYTDCFGNESLLGEKTFVHSMEKIHRASTADMLP